MLNLRIIVSVQENYHHLLSSKLKLIWLELIKQNHHLLKNLEHRSCIMTNYTPVEGKSGFFRDSESTAIINRDKKAYLAYMQTKKGCRK